MDIEKVAKESASKALREFTHKQDTTSLPVEVENSQQNNFFNKDGPGWSPSLGDHTYFQLKSEVL